MSRPLPTWATMPIEFAAAAVELGITEARLKEVVRDHPYYDPRGRRKIFYPDQIRRLRFVIDPPKPTSLLDVIRNHIAGHVDAAGLTEYEAFLGQEFTGKVYLVRCGDRVKIGFTTHWERRFRVLKTACPHPVTVIAVMPGNRILERILHVGLSEYRRHGEWFEETGEVASLTEALKRFGADTT